MSWFEPEMRDRSREIIGRSGSNRTVEGPSKRPARSPCTRRDRAWPASRPSETSWLTDEPSQRLPGSEQSVDHHGQDRRVGLATTATSAASRALCSVDSSGPTERRLGERTQQRPPSLGRLHPPGFVVDAWLPGGPHRAGSAEYVSVPPSSMT